jgi:hypothetical protein
MKSKPWDFLNDFRGTMFTGEWPTLVETFRITAHRYPENTCFTSYDPEYLSFTYRQASRGSKPSPGTSRKKGCARERWSPLREELS